MSWQPENAGDYPTVNSTPNIRHDGSRRDRPDSDSSLGGEDPPLRRSRRAGDAWPLLALLVASIGVIAAKGEWFKFQFGNGEAFAQDKAVSVERIEGWIKTPKLKNEACLMMSGRKFEAIINTSNYERRENGPGSRGHGWNCGLLHSSWSHGHREIPDCLISRKQSERRELSSARFFLARGFAHVLLKFQWFNENLSKLDRNKSEFDMGVRGGRMARIFQEKPNAEIRRSVFVKGQVAKQDQIFMVVGPRYAGQTALALMALLCGLIVLGCEKPIYRFFVFAGEPSNYLAEFGVALLSS